MRRGACRCLVAAATGEGTLSWHCCPHGPVSTACWAAYVPSGLAGQAAGPVSHVSCVFGAMQGFIVSPIFMCRSPDPQHLRM